MPLQTGPETLSIDNAKLPFAEQIAFFRGKKGLNLPSEHFDDITAEQHRKGFAVAGAMKADLLTDFYNAVEEAISEGQSIDWFRGQFDAITEKHGWAHTGSAGWRTRTIYQTNMLTSYAEGRAAQLADPDLRAAMPYLRYNLGNSENHRPLHVSWSGMTLPHDDPWWDAHMPVKAWGCHCWVSATADPNPAKSKAPEDHYYKEVDRWGEVHTIPLGVDYGFHKTEGFIPDIRKYPPPIAESLKAEFDAGKIPYRGE